MRLEVYLFAGGGGQEEEICLEEGAWPDSQIGGLVEGVGAEAGAVGARVDALFPVGLVLTY